MAVQLPSSHSFHYIYVTELAWRASISPTVYYEYFQSFRKVERMWQTPIYLTTYVLQLVFNLLASSHMAIYKSILNFDACQNKLQASVHFTHKHFSMYTVSVQHLFSMFFLEIYLNIIKCTNHKCTSQCVIQTFIKKQNITLPQKFPSSLSLSLSQSPPHPKGNHCS